MICITRVVYTNPLHTTNLFFSFFAAHVLLVWFIQQQTFVLLSILQNQGIQIQRKRMPWELYTSGATTCTYTYEIMKSLKRKKVMGSHVAISSKTCHFIFQVWTPKATRAKLPMKDAGSTGLRRTMPSSPGDALPITANLNRIKLMSMSRAPRQPRVAAIRIQEIRW